MSLLRQGPIRCGQCRKQRSPGRRRHYREPPGSTRGFRTPGKVRFSAALHGGAARAPAPAPGCTDPALRAQSSRALKRVRAPVG
ncbi:hypothetical protein NDU88_000413 [Pleurodeles waltl]|uniref:Uncharacterized protein n=1 Tax=Pleurodeles waltl TaxID=8319 RepID=A0AAV7S616_PLEWA|nr:hypothetical protein NDU88_000413 [Pleurodeles waltl]